MSRFNLFGKRRAAKDSSSPKRSQPPSESFILEPIYTPSALLESSEQTEELADLEIFEGSEIELETEDFLNWEVDETQGEGDAQGFGEFEIEGDEVSGEWNAGEPTESEIVPLEYIYSDDSESSISQSGEEGIAPEIEDSISSDRELQNLLESEPGNEEALAPEIEDSISTDREPHSLLESELGDTAVQDEIEISPQPSGLTQEADSPQDVLSDRPFLTTDEILVNGEEVTSLESVPDADAVIDPLTVTEMIGSTPNLTFDEGVFTVGETGIVGIDFLFDGGGYAGELAIFSLFGMEQFELGSEAFIAEAASRALSDSELGHVVIRDRTLGAKFSATLSHEGNFNYGEYQGRQTVTMRPGDRFGVMLIPNGTVQQVLDNPTGASSDLRPLFSLATSNPEGQFYTGQIADVTGGGSTFVMEDLRVDSGSDRDYNDIVFQVTGATGQAVHLDRVIDPSMDWRATEVGQELLAYIGSDESHPSVELVPSCSELQTSRDKTANKQ